MNRYTWLKNRREAASVMGLLSKSAATLCAAALLVAGGGAHAFAFSSGGTITVCVSHSGGTLYKGRECAKHDRTLSWTKQGPSGATGPQGAWGPKGPAGPPGAEATKLCAVVSSTGTLLRGSRTVSARTVADGYEVVFERGVRQCSYQATLGAAQAEVGEVGVGPRNGNADAVFVHTADSSGATTARGFNVAVFC